ncbi:hypothetical protein RI367_002028 [Sorochytrium milnesiophthora]
MFGFWTTATPKPTVLVTEADSWLGFYTVRQCLLNRNIEKVIATVQDKHTELSKALEKEGAELREWDLSSTKTVRESVRGAQCVLLVPPASMSAVHETKVILDALKATKGIHTVVLCSVEGAQEERMSPIFKMFYEIEEMFQRTKFEYSCTVRTTFTMQQAFVFSSVIQNKGTWPWATKTGKFAPVNTKDIGFALSKLVEKSTLPLKYQRQVLTFTGPELMTGKQLVHAASSVLDAKISYEPSSLEDMHRLLQKLRKTDPDTITHFTIELMMGWFKLIKNDKLDVCTDDLEMVMDRDAQTVKAFFEEHGDAFRPHGSLVQGSVRESI